MGCTPSGIEDQSLSDPSVRWDDDLVELARRLQSTVHPAIAAVTEVQQEVFVGKFSIGRTVAATVCSIVLSAAFVLGAVGPAQAGAGTPAPVVAARSIA